MTRDEAVDRMQEGLGFRTNLTTQCISRLIEAQADLEAGKTLPPFLIEEDDTLALTAGSQTVDLPEGFIKEDENWLPHYTISGSTTPRFLRRKTLEEALRAYETTEDGGPQVYIIRKDTLMVFPTPDINYTLTWNYYKKAQKLTSNVENAWLADDIGAYWLIGEAGWRLARNLRDANAVTDFDQMRQNARASLLAKIIDAEQSGGPFVMGADS